MEGRSSISSMLVRKLSNGTRRWILGVDGPRHQKSYFQMLHREIGGDLHRYLVEDFADQLKARGINPLSSEKAAITVRKVLLNTNDLRHRLLTAPDPDGVVSDGRFSLSTLIDDDHQGLVADSLTQAAQDEYEKASFSDMLDSGVDPSDITNLADTFVGFTGNRMWNTIDSKDSRHMDLDGEVQGSDDTFTMPDGSDFYGPRDDPTNVAQSSNCQCSLTYEYQNDDGELEWR